MKRSVFRLMKDVVLPLVRCLVVSSLAVAVGAMHAAPRTAAQGGAWLEGWPMVGHDPQRTNRSSGIGPMHPHLVFTTPLLAGSVVIGGDGSVYGWGRAGLQAVNANGQSRWALPILGLEGGPPALTPNGLLFVNGLVVTGKGTDRKAGMAVLARTAATGAPRWAIHALPWAPAIGGTFYLQDQSLIMGRSVPLSKGVAPLVTPAGTLYMPFVGPGSPNAGVEMITTQGQPVRRLSPNVEPAEIAWSADGTLYEVGLDGLVAFAPGGVRRWVRPLGEALNNPAAILVGMHGAIYASDGPAVAAYAPSGQLLWRRRPGAVVAALAERADGDLLVVSSAALSALSPRGTRLWRRPLGRPSSTTPAAASIAVDRAGRAYVGSSDGKVRAISPSGALLWTMGAGDSSNPYDSPSVSLGPGGTLVVSGIDGQLRMYR
jgi:outer membrane protein assembly factor BamB